MLTQFIKFLRVLGSEASPMQISLAAALAMIIGFTPLMSFHNLIVIFILLSFRINLAAFILSLSLFTVMAYLLDPVFHQLGLQLLQNESLQTVWTTMYNSVFWRLTHFNNTIVLGGLAISLLLFFPLVLMLNFLIKQYRSHFLVFCKNSRVARFIQSSKLLTRFSSAMES